MGRATCHVRSLLNEIYGAGQQKAKRKEIESYLGDALDFVTHIRNRVLAYQAFGHELRKYLSEQRAAHPELKESLDSLDALAAQIDERVEPRIQTILHHKMLQEVVAKVSQHNRAAQDSGNKGLDAKGRETRQNPGNGADDAKNHSTSPTPPILAAQLNRDFIAKGLLDYSGADWEAKLKKEYTDPLTQIGGQQDEMVGECRWVVKALRQKAAMLMASDPRMAPVAAEIRARTQKMLRGGAAYEGARH